MTIVKDLKETLNGGFGGLYGEVVTEDCYRLRGIQWEPEVIFDLGANVGVFTRYARELFRTARIIAVEPDEENCAHLRKFTEDSNLILIEAAIGKGTLWHYLNSRNGAMQCYLSEGLGYPGAAMKKCEEAGTVEQLKIPTVLPAELVRSYWKPGQRSVMKIDIEGAENAIFEDPDSVAALKQMDYIAMEVHFYATNGAEHKEVTRKTMEVLQELEDTHTCELNNKNFWATKK